DETSCCFRADLGEMEFARRNLGYFLSRMKVKPGLRDFRPIDESVPQPVRADGPAKFTLRIVEVHRRSDLAAAAGHRQQQPHSLGAPPLTPCPTRSRARSRTASAPRRAQHSYTCPGRDISWRANRCGKRHLVR